jgi:hypothetical protein
MKALKLLLLLPTLWAMSAGAKGNTSLGLAIHLTLGAKQVNARNAMAEATAMPAIASTLGGGTSWNLHRAVLGAEFYYSGGTNKDNQKQFRYGGFNSNVYTGYQIVKRRGWQLAPLLGIGMSRNGLQVSTTASGYSLTALQNAGLIVHTALRLEKVMQKGNYMGLKLGYNISAKGQRAWQYVGSSDRTGTADAVGGFLLQLNIGGLIRLK